MYRNISAQLIAILAICSCTSAAFAEDFFSNYGSNATPQNKNTPIQPMTPNDFNSDVNALSKQNQQALSQQIKPQAPAGSDNQASSNQAMPSQAMPSQPTPAPDTSGMNELAPTPTAPSPIPGSQPPNQQPTPDQSYLPPSHPGNLPEQSQMQMQQPTPEAAQPQDYTGFQGGNSNSGAGGGTNSNKQSSGWNIEY